MKPNLYNLQVETVKYSEPKILGYLAGAIIMFIVLICLMFFVNIKIEARLAHMEKSVTKQLAAIRTDISGISIISEEAIGE